MNDPRLGFVGLGQLGGLVARHLVSWPGGLVVCDVRPEATKPFADRGASAVDDVGAVASEGASIISVMVLDDDQVVDVVHRVFETATQDTIVAIHSTIRPETAERLDAEAAGYPVSILDAPVTGGPSGARAGSLAVMVGGREDAVERCRAPFGCFSDRVVHFGPVGSATRAKIARNLITFAGYVAAGEAQRLAQAAGVDLGKLGEVVRYSDTVTGGPGTIMLRDDVEPIATDDPWFDVMAHTRDLGEKDLFLALGLAEQLDIDLPFTALAHQLLGPALGVPHQEKNE
jgi:3-hydroxyisobutyrate dehydrogenase-like beta-hydroxyacid dehydrogenase